MYRTKSQRDAMRRKEIFEDIKNAAIIIIIVAVFLFPAVKLFF